MTINEQLRSNILRYHFVEHWRVGTIATQLGVHHSSVERIISQAGMPKIERAKRASIIDPYLPFIHDTLAQYPKLSAARLYQMVQSRGYNGGPSHFRQWIAQLRPRKVPEAHSNETVSHTVLSFKAVARCANMSVNTAGVSVMIMSCAVCVVKWLMKPIIVIQRSCSDRWVIKGFIAESVCQSHRPLL